MHNSSIENGEIERECTSFYNYAYVCDFVEIVELKTFAHSENISFSFMFHMLKWEQVGAYLTIHDNSLFLIRYAQTHTRAHTRFICVQRKNT